MTRAEAIATIVSIEYRDWELLWDVYQTQDRVDMLGFQWSFKAPDAYVEGEPDTKPTRQLGRQHYEKLDLLTEESLVRRIFEAVRLAEEHEAREFFRYQGERPFDPHKRLI